MKRRVFTGLLYSIVAALIVSIPLPNAALREKMTNRTMIITFDDGPRDWIMPKILDFLRKEKVPAAFFIQCWQAETSGTHKKLVLSAHLNGHGIANHTYGHGNIPEFLQKKGRQWVLKDVERCSAAIKSIVGYSPRFFRPPFWAITAGLRDDLIRAGYTVQLKDHPSLPPKERVTRDFDTADYARYKEYLGNPQKAAFALVNEIRARIIRRENDGITIHILVFHELPLSLDALGILVPEWRESGYEFQTLPWLYGKGGYGK